MKECGGFQSLLPLLWYRLEFGRYYTYVHTLSANILSIRTDLVAVLFPGIRAWFCVHARSIVTTPKIASHATGVRLPGRRFEVASMDASILQTFIFLTNFPNADVSFLCSVVDSRNVTCTYRVSLGITSLKMSNTSKSQHALIPLITYGSAQTCSSQYSST